MKNKKSVRRVLAAAGLAAILPFLSGCAAWEAFKVPFDKFSYAMSGESRYNKEMEKYREAVEWDREVQAQQEQNEEAAGALQNPTR